MKKTFTVILRVLIAICTLYTPVLAIFCIWVKLPIITDIVAAPGPLNQFRAFLFISLIFNLVWLIIICISPFIVATFGVFMCARNKIAFRICTYLPYILSIVMNIGTIIRHDMNIYYDVFPLIMDFIVLAMIVTLDVLVPPNSKKANKNTLEENRYAIETEC